MQELNQEELSHLNQPTMALADFLNHPPIKTKMYQSYKDLDPESSTPNVLTYPKEYVTKLSRIIAHH